MLGSPLKSGVSNLALAKSKRLSSAELYRAIDCQMVNQFNIQWDKLYIYNVICRQICLKFSLLCQPVSSVTVGARGTRDTGKGPKRRFRTGSQNDLSTKVLTKNSKRYISKNVSKNHEGCTPTTNVEGQTNNKGTAGVGRYLKIYSKMY